MTYPGRSPGLSAGWRTTLLATGGDGSGEVSRCHSRYASGGSLERDTHPKGEKQIGLTRPSRHTEGQNLLLQGVSRKDSMYMEQQQDIGYQMPLFGAEDSMCHGAGGDGGTVTAAFEEQQLHTASVRKRALTTINVLLNQ